MNPERLSSDDVLAAETLHRVVSLWDGEGVSGWGELQKVLAYADEQIDNGLEGIFGPVLNDREESVCDLTIRADEVVLTMYDGQGYVFQRSQVETMIHDGLAERQPPTPG